MPDKKKMKPKKKPLMKQKQKQSQRQSVLVKVNLSQPKKQSVSRKAPAQHSFNPFPTIISQPTPNAFSLEDVKNTISSQLYAAIPQLKLGKQLEAQFANQMQNTRQITSEPMLKKEDPNMPQPLSPTSAFSKAQLVTLVIERTGEEDNEKTRRKYSSKSKAKLEELLNRE